MSGSPFAFYELAYCKYGETMMLRPILVVDDDKAVRDFLQNALAEEGYDVIIASDGVEALKIATERELGLIILDMRMPNADGWAFLDEYCGRSPDTAPIIATSAEKHNFRMMMCANEFMPKPYNLEALLECVQKYVKPEVYFSH